MEREHKPTVGVQATSRIIVVTEPYWRGLAHATSNASLIRVVRAAFPDEPILFTAEKGHLAAVLAESADVENLRTEELIVPDEESWLYGRLFRDFRNVLFALRHARRSDATIVFCSSYSSVLAICCLAQRLLGRKHDRVLMRIHGNLNEVADPPAPNPVRRALSLGRGLAYARAAGVRLVVLEESIRNELLSLRPELAGCVHVIEEPVTADSDAPPREPLPSEPIRFAFLGVGTRAKGIDRFIALAANVGGAAKGKAEFEVIGRVHESMSDLPMDALAYPPSDRAMPRREYEDMLRRCHYVCAFYQPEYYRLSASGVLLDAVTHRKPLISTNIAFVENLFARFGDIGSICRSQDEAVQFVLECATAFDPKRYRAQTENLARVAAARSLAEIAKQMRHAVLDRANA